MCEEVNFKTIGHHNIGYKTIAINETKSANIFTRMISPLVRHKSNFLFVITLLIIIFSFAPGYSPINAQQIKVQDNSNKTTADGYHHPMPVLKDPRLKVEIVADGLTVPTGILFLDKNNILVLQRYTSSFDFGGITTVNLVTNGHIRSEPVLSVLSGLCDRKTPKPECSMFNERGLLGITSRKINPDNSSVAGNLEVYLYYTEITLTGEILGNRVYKYLWDGEHLVNPSLILDLPGGPGPDHNAGKILIGPDGYLYAVIGDKTVATKAFPVHEDPTLVRKKIKEEIGHRGQVQNIQYGGPPDNTSAVFRVNPETGKPAHDNPFINVNGTINPNLSTSDNIEKTDNNTQSRFYNDGSLDRYYAYGIRNSFGLAFDPVTGNLWDTENGEFLYDEINMIEPGFNSGWIKVMGPIDRVNATKADLRSYKPDQYALLKLDNKSTATEADLVNFPGSKYSDPEFSWKNAVGVTALGFLNSSKLGEKYRNNLFVGDYIYGNLYSFRLNNNRDGIDFTSAQRELIDKVADNPDELAKVTLGTGFDVITDIKTGPDGYLYIVSYSEYSSLHPANVSRIYRIVPAS